MRKDLYHSRLGLRAGTGYKRVWLEDTASRLSRNGFVAGTPFTATRRMGPGLNLAPAVLGDYTVSARRGTALFSLENNTVTDAFPVNEIVISISVGLISIVPSVRAFSVRKAVDEVWRITADGVVTPREQVLFADGIARPAGRPTVVEAAITDANLIEATEFLAWAKPAEVRLAAEGLAELTARRFLVGCGWELESAGVLRR